MLQTVDSAVKGFLAGAISTVPMSGAFVMAQVLGTISELPPRKVVNAVSPRLEEPQRTRLGAGAHVLVGAVAGAAYGAVVPRRARGAISGVAAGLAVWVFGYELVMPAVTGMPQAHRDDHRRALAILFAHVVYGAALGSMMGAGRRKP